ncbi:MAG: hypothetical protein AAB353_04800 [Candidatus Hydrogenedentota bacterium]
MKTDFNAIASLLFVAMLIGTNGCFWTPGEPNSLYVRSMPGEVFDTAAVRGEFRPLRLRRTGFEYRCTECHEDFTSLKRKPELPGEHAAIYAEFNHGLNTNCLNCHNSGARNDYIDHEGSVISSEQPARLCAKCHGPLYRDWERGIHGRQNGYWDADLGPREKLLCVQCHDPHNPKFKPMTPEPPPQTRGMSLAHEEV